MENLPINSQQQQEKTDRGNQSSLAYHPSVKEKGTSPSDRWGSSSKTDSDVSLAETVAAFTKLLENHRSEKQIIIIQDFPDPDALSSAWTYQLIAQEYKIESDIVYAGTISHQENIALVKLTSLPARRLNARKFGLKDLEKYQGCVLVDNQGTTSQLMPLVKEAALPIVAIIDHHSNQGNLEAEFIDLRPHLGATATIFCQYLQEGLLELTSSNKKHVKCATALMHGIRSDTNSLLQAQEEDFVAASFLSRFYDLQLLKAVLQTSRSKRVMSVIEQSLKNRIVQNNFSLAGVSYLRYEDRDAIPQAADFLVTEENVHTAIVYGIIHDEDREIELLIGSLRTDKITLDPDEFIKEALGHDPQGSYFGGGRNRAGGFEISLGFLSGFNSNSRYTKVKWETFDTQIKQKFLRLVNPQDKLLDNNE